MIYQLVLAGFLTYGFIAMCWIFQALLEYLEKMASKFDEGDIQCPQVAMENEFFASQHNWPHCTRHSEIVGLPYSKGRQLQKTCTNHWLYFGFLFDILLLTMTLGETCPLAMAGTAPWNRRRNFRNQQPLGGPKKRRFFWKRVALTKQ